MAYDRKQAAADLVLRLLESGINVDVKGGKLNVTPADKLTPLMRSRLRQYKPEILELNAEWLAEIQEERRAIVDSDSDER